MMKFVLLNLQRKTCKDFAWPTKPLQPAFFRNQPRTLSVWCSSRRFPLLQLSPLASLAAFAACSSRRLLAQNSSSSFLAPSIPCAFSFGQLCHPGPFRKQPSAQAAFAAASLNMVSCPPNKGGQKNKTMAAQALYAFGIALCPDGFKLSVGNR